MNKITVGTRGSKLALWQAKYVADQVKKAVPNLEIELKTIKTNGDIILDTALYAIGDKGLFTKEIEQALIEGTVDIAVHSLKDLPGLLDERLCLGAFLPREDPRDVLIASQDYSLKILPRGAVIGTSSLRRKAQLKAFRPDLKIVDLRGNVETRLRKMKELELDGIILAYAGLKRLGLTDLITEIVSYNCIMPAVGQGTIVVEARKDDEKTLKILKKIDHYPTRIVTQAERSFLNQLEGGCQVPIAAIGEIVGETITLNGLVAGLEGQQVFKSHMTGPIKDANLIGCGLARQLLDAGAGKILDELRG